MVCNDTMEFHSSVSPDAFIGKMEIPWKTGNIPIPGCGTPICLRDLIFGISESMKSAKDMDILKVLVFTNSQTEQDDWSCWDHDDILIHRLCYMDYIPFSAVASIYRIYCCAWEHDYSECNPPDIRCIYVFDCADMPRLFNDPDEFLEISLRKLFRDSSNRKYSDTEINSLTVMGCFEPKDI